MIGFIAPAVVSLPESPRNAFVAWYPAGPCLSPEGRTGSASRLLAVLRGRDLARASGDHELVPSVLGPGLLVGSPHERPLFP